MRHVEKKTLSEMLSRGVQTEKTVRVTVVLTADILLFKSICMGLERWLGG